MINCGVHLNQLNSEKGISQEQPGTADRYSKVLAEHHQGMQ